MMLKFHTKVQKIPNPIHLQDLLIHPKHDLWNHCDSNPMISISTFYHILWESIRSNDCNWVSFKLSSKYNYTHFNSDGNDKFLGRGPVNLLKERSLKSLSNSWNYKSSNSYMFPNSSGSDPLNWLFWRYKLFTFFRFPISFGRVPFNWLSCKRLKWNREYSLQISQIRQSCQFFG